MVTFQASVYLFIIIITIVKVTEFLQCAKHHIKYFTYFMSFTPYNNPTKKVYVEIETQNDYLTHL